MIAPDWISMIRSPFSSVGGAACSRLAWISRSEGSASCGMAGDSAAEVVLGSEDLDLSWTGEELRASIETKFAFKTSPEFEVIGLSGSFEMTEGTIGFEAFDITELYAAVAFGALENYLSASIHCTFTEFDVEGGVFFGRTCSLDPFAWDPDVQAILGDPPFTGYLTCRGGV